jgi:hypothetical protein
MNLYKHTAVSFTIGALLLIVFKKIQLSIASFLTGVLLDLDHIFDYYMNQELREKAGYLRHPQKLLEFLSHYYQERKPTYRLYKPLHSLELLILMPILYILGLWNVITVGIFIGFATHMVMDFLPTGSLCTLSLICKVYHGFPQGSDVLKLRISRTGRDINRCQSCSVSGETIPYRNQLSYIGFTRKSLKKVSILCPDCYDRVRGKKD